ncbi:fimbrial biogenesis chaperone [Erwinia tasmaniensis]|nr:molecular chaperone [Erwinia tasmaniensis]
MKNILRCLPATFLFLASAHASIVMTGTRIIFPADSKEKTLQFTNPDPVPYVLQLSVSKTPDGEGEKDEDVPFIILPPFSRMEPHSGQSVRLNRLEGSLPEDRESVFYLSFSQIPALDKKDNDQNKLLLAITSKIKIFYRPAGLDSSPEKSVTELIIQARDRNLLLKNPTPYYINLQTISARHNGKDISLIDSVMIDPKSEKSVRLLPASGNVTRGEKIKMVTVNDYGAGQITDTELK